MKRMIIGALAAGAVAAVCGAAEVPAGAKKPFSEADWVRRQGGELVRPGTFTGLIAVVNRQGRMSAAEIEAAIAPFSVREKYNVRLATDGAGATAVLTIIDTPGQPTVLVATEEHWATVNLADIVSDLPGENAKKKFFVSRARKLVVKALSLLCGGGSSQFEGNLMNAAKIRDLDRVDEDVPEDMFDRYEKYLKKLGVTKKETATYRKACKEGWAPQPTNDVQKAIWEKVHAIPKNPMKIEFDPKKGL